MTAVLARIRASPIGPLVASRVINSIINLEQDR